MPPEAVPVIVTLLPAVVFEVLRVVLLARGAPLTVTLKSLFAIAPVLSFTLTRILYVPSLAVVTLTVFVEL